MLHVSHPYLVSLSFYTIPICLLNSQEFLFTCLHSFLYYSTTYTSVKGGESPIKKLIIEKMAVVVMEMMEYVSAPSFISMCAAVSKFDK